MRSILTVTALIIMQGISIAQSENESEHNHKYEIGIANGLVYFLNEKEFSYGLHIHVVRLIGKSNFAMGVGYERIFDEHGHNTVSAVVSYLPVERLALIVAPGIAFTNSNTRLIEFSTHLEMTYEFEIRNFHVGPLIEWAIEPDEMHFTIGLHVGFGL